MSVSEGLANSELVSRKATVLSEVEYKKRLRALHLKIGSGAALLPVGVLLAIFGPEIYSKTFGATWAALGAAWVGTGLIERSALKENQVSENKWTPPRGISNI